MKHLMPATHLLYCFLSCFVIGVAAAATEDGMSSEALFYDDSDWQSLEVNEGELNFIKPLPEKPVLHSHTVLTITEHSIKTGWVDMQQCYSNLDVIAKIDVVYRYKNMKQLEITQLENIKDARVNGQTIQLSDVGQAARLCVHALVNIFKPTAEGEFMVSNGPYHRQFLDGYYPYHVSLTIYYPAEQLGLLRVTPAPRALFKVIRQAGKIAIDTWFEGILKIDLTFIKQ